MAWAVLQHFDTSKNAECTLESVCGLLHKNLKQDLGAVLELDITPKICVLCFVLINNFVVNLSCVWMLLHSYVGTIFIQYVSILHNIIHPT